MLFQLEFGLIPDKISDKQHIVFTIYLVSHLDVNVGAFWSTLGTDIGGLSSQFLDTQVCTGNPIALTKIITNWKQTLVVIFQVGISQSATNLLGRKHWKHESVAKFWNILSICIRTNTFHLCAQLEISLALLKLCSTISDKLICFQFAYK